ncbi:hypothetical protein AERO8C_70572 [Aeromonas veronii]|uniref:Uncharacterized protein n=1 Tax=Aeromonas veronii TaxID=654 RepID=A0A653LB76_AERVE|nr:hypothetical protein AERO8C_70572 [Aeromonas veronii]
MVSGSHEPLVQDVAVEGTCSTINMATSGSPYFLAMIYLLTCTCLDFAQQSLRSILIQVTDISL